MLREFFVPVSEMLFWFTGGELLINTWWFLVWVIGGSVVMVIPLWYGLNRSRRPNTLPALIFLIGFFSYLAFDYKPRNYPNGYGSRM